MHKSDAVIAQVISQVKLAGQWDTVASIHRCSECSNTPIISAGGVHPYLNTPRFFLRICAFYQQMVCTCKVYIC